MEKLSVRHALVASGLAPIDAQVLLAHALGKDRAWLVAHRDDALPEKEMTHFLAMAKLRREQGEPIAYLVGTREFHGLALAVTRDVLIPRPETETLVEQALLRIPRDAAVRVLDLGTGSGAIALAIASERPRAAVCAVDRSGAALEVARGNATRLDLANVECVESDWYRALGQRTFDAIVANPPYIAADDHHLGEGDLRFEPRDALTPGGDGLTALRRIVAEAPGHLAPGGVLAVEHGHDQGDAVRGLFVEAGFQAIVAARDLAGISRVVAGVQP